MQQKQQLINFSQIVKKYFQVQDCAIVDMNSAISGDRAALYQQVSEAQKRESDRKESDLSIDYEPSI